MGKVSDLTGQKFGRLTVIKRAENHRSPNGQTRAQWLCMCDCGNPNPVIVTTSNLKRNNTMSCGCYQKERTSQTNKKYNTYDLSGEYGVGYLSNSNKQFYFDKCDYDKIKEYCWLSSGEYIIARNGNRNISLSRLIMGVINAGNDILVDYKNHNTYDNRKCNLRIVDTQKNAMNKRLLNSNVSGVAGVRFENNKWVAYIKVNYKKIWLGSFDAFEDAVNARKAAEEKYFGEYSYDNSMELAQNY